MRSKLTLLCLMFLCTLNAVAQQLNVTGNVKDALGEYIIGASVLVKGTTNGTITDIDGNFSVNGVEKVVYWKFLTSDMYLSPLL